MSESHLHVHAPHEDAAHGASATHSGPGLNQWVAIFTAVLAALGAIVSYQGSHLMNEVLLYKNESVLQKAHATDQWNYYQAVSTKLHLTELAEELAPASRSRGFADKIAKYRTQKDDLRIRAERLERLSRQADLESTRLNRPHDKMAMALIFLQIAISLASITALTQRRWLFVAALVSAVMGSGLWLWALWLV